MAKLETLASYVSSKPSYEYLADENLKLSKYKEMLEAKILSLENSPQKVVEFARYKQDCRKRALEMAHSELSAWWEKRRVGASVIDEKPNIDVLADKYYNWLISIPE